MGAPDQSTVEEYRRGLPLGATQGTRVKVVVERGGHGCGSGVSGEHASGVQGVGGSGQARVDEDRDGDGILGQESEEDGSGPP